MRKATLTCTIMGSLLAGCTSKNAPAPEAVFVPDNKPRWVDECAAAQAAAGAKSDAMLYAYHFEGDALNSLGRAKLFLMAMSRPVDGPLMIYMEPLAAENSPARREAILDYLVAEVGIEEEGIQVRAGQNPDATQLASEALKRLERAESYGEKKAKSSGSGGLPGATAAAAKK